MRILLIRTSALGDVVHALPVLATLRARLPEATIAWVVDAAFAPLLEGHPDLDQLLPVPLRSWKRERGSLRAASRVWAAVRRIRAFRADVTLDLMGNHKAGVLARLSGAPRRLGHRRADRREPSSALWLNEHVVARGEHAIDRALSVLDALGIATEPAPRVRLACTSDAAGLALLAETPEPPLLIQPGAGWGNKRYPSAAFGAVAAALATDLPVAVLSAPGEEDLAASVVAASGNLARHWHAPSLPMLATLLAGARALVGGDTGPLHLAHALGTPVLGLFGPTDPRRNGPWQVPEAALVRPLPCSFCHRRFAEAKACLLAISPAEVVRRAREMLAAAPAT
jgi:heptosyltransferase-1